MINPNRQTAPERGGGNLLTTATVISVAAIFGLTYSLTAALIALDLAARGLSETYIGGNAAMHALGVLVMAPCLPGLAVRYGPRRLILSALVISAAVLAAFPLLPSVWIWFPLRFLLGAAADVLFVLSETWTNELTTESARGRTMAVYTSALSIGFAGGPLILSAVGVTAWAYVIGAAIAVLAIIPAASPWVRAPAKMEKATAKPWQFIRMAPLAIAVTALNAAVEAAGLSFLPLYATRRGWTEQQGMLLISVLLVGAIVLQLPLGWLADRMNRRRLLAVLAAITTVGALLWPFVLTFPWLAYGTMFVWGGLFVGLYTIMIAVVGSRFSGGDLVGIYAVMGLGWGSGALAGPLVVGPAMDFSPDYGLPLAVAAGCGLFFAFALLGRSRA